MSESEREFDRRTADEFDADALRRYRERRPAPWRIEARADSLKPFSKILQQFRERSP